MQTILAVTLMGLIQAQQYMPVERPIIAQVENKLEIWIGTLRKCESGENDKALNPKDSDGTPSKGRFQFKDSTFNWLSKKYKIPTTSIWNGDEQESILRRMIDDKDIDLTKQFPSCVKKIGLPPTHPDGS